MKQIIYQSIGAPYSVLEVQTVESAKLKSGEVRVSVLATPIHPSNLLKISGQYGIPPKLPEIPGTEGVGEVIEVASDVRKLSVGQRVFIAGYSTWQQEVVGSEGSFIPLPPHGDLLQMSMITLVTYSESCEQKSSDIRIKILI